ncbi:alpha/beta fold hydrolase [Rhodococcoides yunnanense]|uniref:alpha/beta fold hydrolase n=1 Tax=Rhodococcoides yunnanense TaxID=278209 RepID=UPI000934B6FE|nr:alpha/beta hydrolase [Rhodococcus yunnanensis]
MPTVHANGAEIYHEVHGAGEPVLLLHGGFCSLEQMRPQIDSLAPRYQVHGPERPGHGRTPDTDEPFGYTTSVADTLAYMDAVGLKDAHVVGYSDGAIIGLLIAMHYPERIRSLVAISANLHPSGFVGDDTDNWPPDPDAPDTDSTRAHYEAFSPDGPEHADVVVEKLRVLWTSEPDIDPSALAAITAPTLVIAGDRDVIRAEHSRLIATSIPSGQLCVVPGAGHGLMEQRTSLVNTVIAEFVDSLAG